MMKKHRIQKGLSMNTDNDVVIVDGIRTPFAKAGTKFHSIHPVELGRLAVRELIDRTHLKTHLVDEVIMGNVGNPSDAANISRVMALQSGLPESVSAFTVHRNCASGMESITCGVTRIQSGAVNVALVGGVESMSSFPLLFSNQMVQVFKNMMMAKTFLKKLQAVSKMRLHFLKPRLALAEGLTDPFVGLNMGETAELLAREFGISRVAQDQFALQSHQRAIQAEKEGKFKEERMAIVTQKEMVEKDEGPRENQSIEKLSKLSPYFDRRYGSVTVGNACPITDGACALLLMSRKKAKSLGYQPKAVIRSFAYAGCSPSRMGLGPVLATAKMLKSLKLPLKEMDLIELNEAFSAQVLSCVKAFSSVHFAKTHLNQDQALGEVDLQKLNVNGGAIALGHPIGATGSRLTLTLMKELQRRKAQYGLATLCIGGGQGGALLLENQP